MANLNGGRGWLSDGAAASVHAMDAAYGGYLPITSAGRTYAEQAEAYQKYLNGGPLALPPGQSVHESGNACDFGSSAWGWLGLDRGVGWTGARINDYNWVRTVYSETWHAEFQGGSPAGGSGGPSILAVQQYLNAYRGAGLVEDGIDGPATQAAVRAYQAVLGVEQDGVWGPATEAAHVAYHAAAGQWPANALYGEAWVKAIQDKLNRLGYGPLVIDGQDGPATQDAVKRFQTDHGVTPVDGVAGPITNNAMDNALTAAPVGRNITDRQNVEIQKFLIALGYDLGSYGADGDYGAATTAAVIKYQGDVGLTPDGVWGPETDAKAFGTDNPQVVWPVNGYNATTRETQKIQQYLIDNGFSVGAFGADGIYGADTSIGLAQWQDSVDLDADGIYGPASDLKMFPGVPLPDAPEDPTADPLYGKKIPTYPGATWADISPNKSVRTGYPSYFTLHHAADPRAKQTQIDRFMTANDRNVSPNWFVAADGTVAEIVPPDDYRAWTTGAWDHNAVTIETQNTSGDPEWGISEASHEAIAQLVAWAANRYKFPIRDAKGADGVLLPSGVILHREVPGQATACPGPSMNEAWIIARAQTIFTEKYTDQPIPDPEPETDPAKEAIYDLLEEAARQIEAL